MFDQRSLSTYSFGIGGWNPKKADPHTGFTLGALVEATSEIEARKALKKTLRTHGILTEPTLRAERLSDAR